MVHHMFCKTQCHDMIYFFDAIVGVTVTAISLDLNTLNYACCFVFLVLLDM